MRLFVILIQIIAAQAALEKCPMQPIRSIIKQASDLIKDPEMQMLVIRQSVMDLYGGVWGVLIVENATLVPKEVHWAIPHFHDADGTTAFCVTVVKGWQYNVFLAGVRYEVKETSEVDKTTPVDASES